MGGEVAVPFPYYLYLKMKAFILDLASRLVVLGVNGSEGGALGLVVVYALTKTRSSVFFKYLEIFLGMTHSLVLVGD